MNKMSFGLSVADYYYSQKNGAFPLYIMDCIGSTLRSLMKREDRTVCLYGKTPVAHKILKMPGLEEALLVDKVDFSTQIETLKKSIILICTSPWHYDVLEKQLLEATDGECTIIHLYDDAFQKAKQSLLGKINREEHLAILKKHHGEKVSQDKFYKYLDLDLHLAAAVGRALLLGLHESPRKNILDIGTACGYFPFVARALGHDCIAMDIEEAKDYYYADMINFFNVNIHYDAVRAGKPLPHFVEPFDLLTSVWCGFWHGWSQEDWLFFFNDAAENCLSEKADVYIVSGTFDVNDFAGKKEFFRDLGTRDDDSYYGITQGYMRITNLPKKLRLYNNAHAG